MDYKELMAQIEKEGKSKEERAKALQDLQDFIKTENHLYDDHGPLIVGSREQPPGFKSTE